MNNKEIIIITLSFSNNGAEKVFSILANEWARRGHKVFAVQFEKDIFGCESFKIADNVNLITLNRRKHESNKIRRYFYYLKDILNILKENPNATVIAYSFTTQIMVAVLSFFVKNKVIFSERNDPYKRPFTKLSRFIRTLSFYRADICIFQTEYALYYFPKYIQKVSRIIPNPINPVLTEKYMGTKRKTIITAARLTPQKNIPMLIYAFKKLQDKFPDYTLEIFGIGEEMENLEKLIDELKLTNNIFLKGFSVNVNRYMLDCAIYVSSSKYEGISNAVLEAIALGVPTVVTDLPGSRKLISEGIKVFLVPNDDVDYLYNTMKNILEKRYDVEKILENPYKIKNLYNVKKIAEQWLYLI